MSFPVGGVREYVRDMTQALLDVGAGQSFSIYYKDTDLLGRYPQAREVCLNAPHKFVWDHWVLPRTLERDRPDVVWYPHNVSSVGLHIPTVVTVHDLLYFPIPEFPRREYARIDTLYMRLFIRRSLNRAAWIAAVSNWTAFDLMRVLNIPQERIRTIHHAPGPEFRRLPAGDVSSVRATYKLTKPFFLYVGALSARKNVRVLIEAFARVKDTLSHDLVLVGGHPVNSPQAPLDDLIIGHGIGDRIKRLGVVSQEDLVALYNAAEAFVYPSLYEGFGLPPLEALACGCPVISSNATSLPEVVGDAALLFDPHDVDALALLLVEISHNASLREDLRWAGFDRAALFSYDRSARQLLTLLEDAATRATI